MKENLTSLIYKNGKNDPRTHHERIKKYQSDGNFLWFTTQPFTSKVYSSTNTPDFSNF